MRNCTLEALMDFEKLKKEEAELEAMFNGTDVVEEEAPVDTDQPADTTEEQSNESVKEETITQTTDENEDWRYWKNRFTSYKSHSDLTIHDLRTEVAKLRVQLADKDEEISRLVSTVNELKLQLSDRVDEFDNLFDKEDEDLIGEEALNIIKKAMKANKPKDNPEIEAMKRELENLKEQRRLQAEQEMKDLEVKSIEQLKQQLSTVVPNWNDIDTEPEFNNFLNGADPITGYPRMHFFERAIKDRDVSRVADFYREYVSQKPKSREEILASKVSVTGSGASESTTDGRNTQKKIYSIEEYTKFMDAYAKGGYKGKEKEAKLIEKRFDEAFREGRVR